VKGAGEAVDHATDRYRQGLANYFEVLEAQQQLYRRKPLAQIRRDRLLTHGRLYKALGGGMESGRAQWNDQRGGGQMTLMTQTVMTSGFLSVPPCPSSSSSTA